jgi:hypothetical protein
MTADHWSYINIGGEVIAKGFDSGRPFAEGMAVVRCGNKWGYIDKDGEMGIAPQFSYANSFSEGFANVGTGDELLSRKYFYINRLGEKVLDAQGSPFSEGMARIEVKGKHGFINRDGMTVIAPQFDEVGDFSQGLARVRIDSKWGYINKHGRMIIKPQFDETEDFSEWVAAVAIDGMHGYIDSTGKVIIRLQYGAADAFSSGVASVKKGDKWGYIDRIGRFVWEPR